MRATRSPYLPHKPVLETTEAPVPFHFVQAPLISLSVSKAQSVTFDGLYDFDIKYTPTQLPD